MPRKLIVWGEKDFTVEIPDDAKVTFGPFSPPTAASSTKPSYGVAGSRSGTLRIYKGTKTTENVIAVFAGVDGFRDESLPFEEVVPPPPVTEIISYGSLNDEQKEELASLVAKQFADRAMAEMDDDEGPTPGPF
jgi:hypothetical protein